MEEKTHKSRSRPCGGNPSRLHTAASTSQILSPTAAGVKVELEELKAARLTFFRSVTDDDLSASFAGLLHRQGGAQALLVLPQALAFLEAILLHDLVGHRASEEAKQGREMDS